jgi:hypothetical protein
MVRKSLKLVSQRLRNLFRSVVSSHLHLNLMLNRVGLSFDLGKCYTEPIGKVGLLASHYLAVVSRRANISAPYHGNN